MDLLFNHSLKDYILAITEEEPQLLKELRDQTAKLTGLEHIISGPLVGMFLQFLIKIKQAKTCLEIGTFTGYSALYMAKGLASGAKLITSEINEDNAKLAQTFFNKSEQGHQIELKIGPALDTLSSLQAPFDFIFLDADQKNYPIYYPILVDLLEPGGILIADNALWKNKVLEENKEKTTKAIHQFNQLAKEDNRVETLLLPIRDGLLLIYKK